MWKSLIRKINAHLFVVTHMLLCNKGQQQQSNMVLQSTITEDIVFVIFF